MPKHHLQSSEEFRFVYTNGKRFDSKLITAFVISNKLDHHRLGITVSRKVSGSAVKRNRAKRLLREAFRLSCVNLDCGQIKYDWVLNAKRSLLVAKMEGVLIDFEKIAAKNFISSCVDKEDV